jgi:hypothetical protein
MSTFNLQILESINTNNVVSNNLTTFNISNVNYTDNRTLNISSGSLTTIFNFSSASSAGTFSTGSFQYGRITNNSTTTSVVINISSPTESMNYVLATGSSYMMSTTLMTSSIAGGLVFNNISSISLEPLTGSATVEYFIIGN